MKWKYTHRKIGKYMRKVKVHKKRNGGELVRVIYPLVAIKTWRNVRKHRR